MSRTAVSEADVQRACWDYLLWTGWLVIRINSGAFQPEDKNGEMSYVEFYRWQVLGQDIHSDGITDLMALHPSSVWLICEVKRPGKLDNLSDAQRRFRAEVEARGGWWVCVDDVQQLIEMLEARGITR